MIGNKIDKENSRAVTTQEGKQLANSRKMGFFECSAVSSNFAEDINHRLWSSCFQKDNKGISEIFKYLASEFTSRYRARIRTLEKMARDNY